MEIGNEYRKTIGCILSMLALQLLPAQIYNYVPIRHSNFETNPAYLATERYGRAASYIHHGNLFFSGKFSYDALKLSAYSPKRFTGAGLALSHTSINDSVHYSSVAAGIAYRTILFNKIFLRTGFLYKLNTVYSSSGIFGYYNFKSIGDAENKQRTLQNVNLSVSFSSSRERFFISASALNLTLFKEEATKDIVFSQYYIVNIGDLARILTSDTRTNYEFYYTGFIARYNNQKAISFNHYINGVMPFNITREATVRYGLRAGYANNSYIHCTPMVSYFTRTAKRNSWNLQLLCDFAVPLTNKQQVFKPNLQTNLTYLF